MSKVTVVLADGIATYDRASRGVEMALQRRFDNPTGIATHSPDKPGYYLFDVRNWWDGPSEIQDNGDGTLTYTNPWDGHSDTFTV
jgi:hypothetical protein